MNHMGKEILGVLDLAGAELNVFIVAGVGLCFEFVMEPWLITLGCFNYCWLVLPQSQELCFFSLHPPSNQNHLVRDIHLLVAKQVMC